MSDFKVGDRVWAQATVQRIDGKSLRLTFDDDWTLWFLASDCRPVEPVIKECLTTESDSPEILDSSSDPIKVGDVVRLKTDEPYKVPLIVKEFISDSVLCRSECGRRSAWAAFTNLELIERRDPQVYMKQAIREVLLSEVFMPAFAAAFMKTPIPIPFVDLNEGGDQ